MKKLTILLVFLVLLLPKLAGAQTCNVTMTAPTTATAPLTVSGTINIQFTTPCAFDHAILWYGCPDSIPGFDCTGYTTVQTPEGHVFSIPFDTTTIANKKYDFAVATVDSSGAYIGSPHVNPPPGGGDGDEVLTVNNATVPTPSPAPTSTATVGTCAPVITTPADGSTLSGTVMFTISGCPSAAFSRLYLGNATFDLGPTGGAVDTTPVPNGQAYATIIEWDSTGTVNEGTSPTISVTIANGVATPTPSLAPTATPKPTATGTPKPTLTPTPAPTGGVCTSPSPFATASPLPPPGTAFKANDLLNTMGVSTKDIQKLVTKAQIIAGFQYLGLRLGRDDATHNTTGVGSVQDLCDIHAATGVLYDELPIVDSENFGGASGSAITDTKAEWDQLAACGAMFQAEGPNEPNNFGFKYQGNICGFSQASNSFLACAKYQAALYAMVKADPALKGFHVVGMSEIGAEQDNTGAQFIGPVPPGMFTEMPAGTVMQDEANAHNYLVGNCSGTILDNQAWQAENIGRISACQWDACNDYWGSPWRANGNGNFPTAIACETAGSQLAFPKQSTETGIQISATVTADLQGKMTTDEYLDAPLQGWTRTLVYTMHNDGPDNGYGMMNLDGTPTLLGTYIHNLTTILADNSSAFTLNPPAFTVSGMPATGHWLLAQKSTGVNELVLWGEAFSSKTTTLVTVTFPTAKSINVYDITVGITPVSTSAGASVTVNLSDHAMVVEF